MVLNYTNSRTMVWLPPARIIVVSFLECGFITVPRRVAIDWEVVLDKLEVAEWVIPCVYYVNSC